MSSPAPAAMEVAEGRVTFDGLVKNGVKYGLKASVFVREKWIFARTKMYYKGHKQSFDSYLKATMWFKKMLELKRQKQLRDGQQDGALPGDNQNQREGEKVGSVCSGARVVYLYF